ncbi:ATP-binding protein [Melaminivora sp.]|uniref:ATP-binding protein n=1 Tax=Melaminivora sp. TaxID=1933032 RepID=UPI0028A7CFFE|nr:ATP-binding protein [Melaminivora sp.]
MIRKKLPIGIQTFAKIREGDAYYYVDKTPLALQLVAQGSHFFLSRPRRFGKSLFLDTLKELFEGNAALFCGLHAQEHWDWSVKHPVLRFSFGGGVVHDAADLQARLDSHLMRHEAEAGLKAVDQTNPERFRSLIRHLAQATGQRVVVLVDEYDKPILDRIEDKERARGIREALKDFYSVIKDSDADIRFVFLTGVSKFSKVSLFSGLNNLRDITLSPEFSAICGYTDEDVDKVFAPELPSLDRQEIRRWYNGYNWTGEAVYNPFDLLLLFQERQFRPWWFETGTPTFLIKLLTQRQQFTPDLERLIAPETLLSTFDVDTIPTEALMFQAGYLTIARVDYIPGLTQIELRYPNLEVRTALNGALLQALTDHGSHYAVQMGRLYRLLQAGDVAGMREVFHAFFATIPHDWHRNNAIAGYEGYWASVFYSHFAALGVDIVLEDVTNHGRIDMAVRWAGRVYLFEFKVVEFAPQGRALQQLLERRYADKYRAAGLPVHLIGVEFSRDERNIVAFETLAL